VLLAKPRSHAQPGQLPRGLLPETKGWKGGAPRTVQAGDKPLTAGKDFHGCVWDGVLLLQVLAVVRDDVKIAVLPKWPWKGIGRWHSEGLLRSWR
jgi:hypothetical protein